MARSGSLSIVDAANAIGPAAAVKGIDLAIEIASENSLGLVAMRNSTHFGAAGFYARRAARKGLFSIVITNSPARMAPFGATAAFVGTGAIAVGAPLGSHDAFVLDISASGVAQGKITRARLLGQQIEPGLALAPDGTPTTDPALALRGCLLPMAEHKGSGLALALDILTAAISGSDFGYEMSSVYDVTGTPQNGGHLFLAIAPWQIIDEDGCMARVERFVNELHKLEPTPGFEEVLYPGEPGDRLARERLELGIPLEVEDIEHVADACAELGLDILASRFRTLLVD